MNKTQNTNVETQTEEFDRSVCMSFFNDHRELVKRIQRLHGLEMAYKVQSAIIDYGLNGIKPTEEELLQFIPEPVLNQIDNNQKRRSRSFKGEDLEVSRSIILLHRDRPEMSQNAIASELGISKGKVNKTLQKYNNGEYEGVIGFTNTNTDTNTSTITGNDRDHRDRVTVHSTEVASLQNASLPLKEFDFQSDSSFSNENIVKIISNFIKQGHNKTDVVTEFTNLKGWYKCSNKQAVSDCYDYLTKAD